MKRLPRRLGHGEEATLEEHLEELRWRLFVIIGAVVVATIVAFVFHNHVLDWLNQPLPPDRRRVTTLGVTEPFTVSVVVSLYAGITISLPIVLWQLWGFFAPAFEPAAERRVLGLFAMSCGLGLAGLAFGYWVLLPRAVHFLTHYDDAHFHNLIQAKPYYSFVVTVLLGIVVVFETPMAVLGLVALGVLSSRTLRKQRRIGYFVTAVIALALPGPDPVTTVLEVLPMWVLYELSIWLAVIVERRSPRANVSAPWHAQP